jgi:hypothetical protein
MKHDVLQGRLQTVFSVIYKIILEKINDQLLDMRGDYSLKSLIHLNDIYKFISHLREDTHVSVTNTTRLMWFREIIAILRIIQNTHALQSKHSFLC